MQFPHHYYQNLTQSRSLPHIACIQVTQLECSVAMVSIALEVLLQEVQYQITWPLRIMKTSQNQQGHHLSSNEKNASSKLTYSGVRLVTFWIHCSFKLSKREESFKQWLCSLFYSLWCFVFLFSYCALEVYLSKQHSSWRETVFELAQF